MHTRLAQLDFDLVEEDDEEERGKGQQVGAAARELNIFGVSAFYTGTIPLFENMQQGP